MMGMNLSTYVNMLRDGADIVNTETQSTSRYAMLLDGICVGVTLWDGNIDKWTPPENVIMKQLENNSPVSSGWTYDNNVWLAPPLIEVLEETS